MSVLRAPLHTVFLRSSIVSGPLKIEVRARLPVRGVALILGNDLAVFPTPEVVDNPVPDPSPSVSAVFPACAVTRAQSRKFDEVLNLSDSFLCPVDEPVKPENPTVKNKKIDNLLPAEAELALKVDRSVFIQAQKTDLSLAACVTDSETPVYCVVDDLLMRNWHPPAVGNLEWNSVQQVVVTQRFRAQVLSLAHDTFAGHLGIKKTYQRILRYFFWPGLKSDVSRFCRSCHVCQVVGKPNQTIPPTPLQPIPALGEPFEHIIFDCVGPLPKTKSGHQYLLTLMCAATRYPEAFPLRTLKAKAVVKVLVNFFSTFGLPKYVQNDQGTNFTSKLFAQVLSSLSIRHRTSSAYHPQSQGALECFHQPLKSMMKKYCLETGKDWGEGLPFLLLAARETVQESTGFSPPELVFGHAVCGPLHLLREKFLSDTASPSANVLDYVSQFRERLHAAREAAHCLLGISQEKNERNI